MTSGPALQRDIWKHRQIGGNMGIVGIFCLTMIACTTIIHYEVLRTLSIVLPGIRIRARAKLIFVIFGQFLAHFIEIILYAFTIYVLVRYLELGALEDIKRFSLKICLYFSAETYTLGYGDIVPGGGLRLLAGTEALNGLLLIGWSASYTYLTMERFWKNE